MFLEKAIKYKILEFCIDKFFDNLTRNLSSKSIAIGNMIIRVYRGYPVRSNDLSLIAKIETPECEVESSILLEDCMDIFASVGTHDGIDEITAILYSDLVSGIPMDISVDEETRKIYDGIYDELERKIMEVLGISKSILNPLPTSKITKEYRELNDNDHYKST